MGRSDGVVGVMTDLPVLRSRQASGIERRPPQGPSDALVEKAKMLAAAGADTLPKGYANKPGSCLMVLDWADRHDVSIFEALAEVSMVYGRPVISAKMQKRLAARAGYRTEVVESSPQAAAVVIVRPDGTKSEPYRYTIETAKALGLVKGNVWTADPQWMLIKRATTRALELHGPDELVSLFADDDEPEAHALPPVEAPGDAAPIETTEHQEPAPAAQQEPARTETPTLNDVLEAAAAKKIKPAALKAQAIAMGYDITAINQVMDNDEALMDLADWIDQQ